MCYVLIHDFYPNPLWFPSADLILALQGSTLCLLALVPHIRCSVTGLGVCPLVQVVQCFNMNKNMLPMKTLYCACERNKAINIQHADVRVSPLHC
jgi:hypothetical protein